MKFKLNLKEAVSRNNIVKFCFFILPTEDAAKLDQFVYSDIRTGIYRLSDIRYNTLCAYIFIGTTDVRKMHADMDEEIKSRLTGLLSMITHAVAYLDSDDIVRTNIDKAIDKFELKDSYLDNIINNLQAALIHYYRAEDCELIEKYLGEDSFKYPVGKITDNNFFDTNYSEIGYVRDLLRNPVRDNKEFKIEYLSPQEYFQACAEIFNSTVDKQIRQIEDDEEILNQLYRVHQSGNQFPLTYINYADKTQEGRHRMYLIGELYGWDKKYPVGIIRWVDKDRAEREAEEARQEDIRHYVRNDIENLRQWSYDSFEEFESEVSDWKIPKWEKDYDFEAELIDKGSEYIIRIEGVDFVFDKDEIKIRDQEPNYDDLDIEDLE